ncbi:MULTISPECIES: DUF1090 family protein [unclassified Acinetobacter]|uniref:DUF1090 family protein n=1 Tax=unclassified Acinetobacter TaxID=196816 RepID=UPI00190948FA|nr:MULTISPECIES: DUF1090 family protein [unclassified Acinetobacter]MBK0063767.1 DUF1090 family protein [Acinetobacter sp. S55]MBK0066944.1 DUF1090 family protein [Acinetobacter sp. S54]
MNNVKKTVVVLATVLVFISSTYAAQDCEIKKQELTYQLHHAEKYASNYRVEDLKRAIESIDRYCHDDTSVQIRIQVKTKQKIKKLKTELSEAQQKQDTKKIAKTQQELNKALFELEQIQSIN